MNLFIKILEYIIITVYDFTKCLKTTNEKRTVPHPTAAAYYSPFFHMLVGVIRKDAHSTFREVFTTSALTGGY